MKKIFTLLCVAFLATSLFANVVTGTCGDNLQWAYDTDTHALTITGSGDMWDYYEAIPWAQVAREITSVSLPDGLTSIGSTAFLGCSSLTSVTLPNSVTSIGYRAFYDCTSLTSITIPNSVTSIGNDAFESCSSLTSVTIGNSVESIGNDAFEGCSSLTSVTLPNSVTSIGYRAFYDCTSLTSITIPNSVTSIGGLAFQNCSSLSSVTIPSSVISIGDGAFYDCSQVTMQGSTPPSIAANTFNNNATISVPCSAMDAYLAAPVWQFLDLHGLNYNVNLTATEGGSAKITATDCESNSITIEATVRPYDCWFYPYHYKFSRWSDGNTDNPRTVTLTKDVTLTAEFEESKYYTVKIYGEMLSGSYEREEDCSTYWSSFEGSVELTMREGTSISLREDGGCGTFLGWSDGVTDNERTITITSDTTISSRFDTETYSVSITAGEGGYLEYGNIEHEYNECNRNWMIYTCAYANDGYYFVGWSDGNTNNCIDIYPDDTDINLVAQFAPKKQVQLLLGVDNASRNMGSVSGSGIYYSGDYVTITATPNAGYHFLEWSDGNGDATRELYLQSDTTLFATFAAGEYGGKCGENLYWTYSDNTITITGSGDMDLETYPAWNNYYDDWYDNVTAVQFPEGITSIDDYAFSEMSLTNVVVPASVTYFGENAFAYNDNLTRFEYQGTEAVCDSYDAYNAILYRCHNLHYFKGQVNMLSYDNDYLDTVIITSGEMFDRYYYTTYIDNSNANNTHFGEGYLQDDVLAVETLLLPNGLLEIGDFALHNARHLEQITIPAGVTRIGESAFEECRSLESVTFAGKVLREIDDWAFYNCHSLKDITIPEGVTSIGKAAFFDCSHLKEITLPSSMQSIEDNAFGQCAQVRKMNVRAAVPPVVESETFEDIDRSIEVLVPQGTLKLYREAPYWQEFFYISESEVPSNVGEVSTENTIIHKILRNGQLLILRDGKTYNVMGQEL